MGCLLPQPEYLISDLLQLRSIQLAIAAAIGGLVVLDGDATFKEANEAVSRPSEWVKAFAWEKFYLS